MDASTPSAPPAVHRAVVLGASLTGMLAAAVLAQYAREVVVVDRDELPADAAPRPGLPQGHHAHLLWSGGERAIEELAPGMRREWLDAGARYAAMPDSLIMLTPHGWVRRGDTAMQHQIVCSRDLLDATARGFLLSRPGITVRTGSYADGLIGGPARVTGVRLRDLATGGVEDLRADLVVDTTGRKSHAPQWLTAIGLPKVAETTVDPGLVYASRWYRAPDWAENFPVISLQPDPGKQVPGRAATLLPVEGGRWLVTLAGTCGAEPTADPDEFEAYASTAPHPIVADLIAGAEPLSKVRLNRSCSNRRRYYERLRRWPAGFVVLGDAVAATNPIYGQGMTIAAQAVRVLRDQLRKRGLTDARLASAVQRRIGRLVQAPWDITTGQDIRFPGATGPKAPLAGRMTHLYVDRLSRTAMSSEAVMRALFAVMSLDAPPTALFRPAIVKRVIQGPPGRALTEPPLTAAERAHLYPAPTPAGA